MDSVPLTPDDWAFQRDPWEFPARAPLAASDRVDANLAAHQDTVPSQ